MRRFLYSVLLILFTMVPVKVFGEGYISVSPSSLTIEEGSSKTFEITAYNAIGDVYIVSNNSAIASVDVEEWSTGMIEEKMTKTGAITVTGNSVGTVTITLTIEAATFDEEDLAGQIKTINVNVVAKPNTPPTSDKNNNEKEDNKEETNDNINQENNKEETNENINQENNKEETNENINQENNKEETNENKNQEEKVDNPKTGDALIYIISIISVITFCFGGYYFYKINKNNKKSF